MSHCTVCHMVNFSWHRNDNLIVPDLGINNCNKRVFVTENEVKSETKKFKKGVFYFSSDSQGR